VSGEHPPFVQPVGIDVAPVRGDESVFVLFKGGRLPSWYLLSEEERRAAEQHHIDLMLSVAAKHGMKRLEGFRLIGRQYDWERFWVIEFPTFAGAEAWIEAEIAPPYGLHGYYEYELARAWSVAHLATWPTFPRPVTAPRAGDPHQRPVLGVDPSSVVVLLFGRGRPGYEAAGDARGDEEHVGWMQQVARDHRLIRIEAFQAIARPADWHRAWVIEFPDLAGAEAWIDTETLPPHIAYSQKAFFLARRWSPDYFASWIPKPAG
jgi:hypothetical protein